MLRGPFPSEFTVHLTDSIPQKCKPLKAEILKADSFQSPCVQSHERLCRVEHPCAPFQSGSGRLHTHGAGDWTPEQMSLRASILPHSEQESPL